MDYDRYDRIRAVQWRDDHLRLLDQRRLPHEEIWIDCRDAAEVTQAIRDLAVRGAPAIGIAAAWGVAMSAQQHAALDDVLAMLRAAGLTNVQSEQKEHVPGDAIHEMGGARMGLDPRASVLNGWSQAHDAANLFVTDGAQMASTSCVNPSLTFMAMTARAADHAVGQVKASTI